MVNLPADGSGSGPRNDLRQLIRDVAELKARVAQLTSSSRQSEAMTIGRGGLTVKQPGDITIVDPDGNQIWSANDGPLKVRTFHLVDESAGLPAVGWSAPKCSYNIPVPAGFTQAVVQISVNVGASFAGAGNIGVQPFVGSEAGEAISNGVPDSAPCSVPSTLTTLVTGLSGGSVNVYLQGYADGTVVGNSNAHLSGSAIFLR